MMTKKLLALCIPVGLLLLIIGIVCGQYQLINEFIKGFLQGISAVFMVVGLINMGWSIGRKIKSNNTK
ncbi:hypothetical protein [Clostridium gasigenes]|uniref:hypothetical protein n=2 Tax=Clostridium gasigenes TaxID=94869 RepID=UPI001C0B7666|nr:hypothetical protein [Clostridium gasigenes]MBU3104518.1 hypothetical protein [Clostridium gasigenes]